MWRKVNEGTIVGRSTVCRQAPEKKHIVSSLFPLREPALTCIALVRDALSVTDDGTTSGTVPSQKRTPVNVCNNYGRKNGSMPL